MKAPNDPPRLTAPGSDTPALLRAGIEARRRETPSPERLAAIAQGLGPLFDPTPPDGGPPPTPPPPVAPAPVASGVIAGAKLKALSLAAAALLGGAGTSIWLAQAPKATPPPYASSATAHTASLQAHDSGAIQPLAPPKGDANAPPPAPDPPKAHLGPTATAARALALTPPRRPEAPSTHAETPSADAPPAIAEAPSANAPPPLAEAPHAETPPKPAPASPPVLSPPLGPPGEAPRPATAPAQTRPPQNGPSLPVGPAPAGPPPAPKPPVGVTAPAAGAASSAAPSATASEGGLLLRARQALGGAPAEALERCAEHRRLYANGKLEQEREVIAIDALARLGRRGEAAERARRLFLTHPNSAYRPRVEAILKP